MNVKQPAGESQFGVFEGTKREGSVIRGAHILGLRSANGTVYESEGVREAAPLYENAVVYLNHNRPGSDGVRPDRRVQDKFGWFENVSFQDGKGLYGDFHFNPQHPFASAFEWWVENQPQMLGFSHAATVLVSKTARDKAIAIKAVESVDLVASPATTKGVFEDAQKVGADAIIVSETNTITESDAMDLSKLTIEELTKGRPDLVTAIVTEAKARETALAAKVDEAIKDVPAELRSDVFVQLVRESIEDAEKVRKLVDDRKALHKAVVVPAPIETVATKKVVEESVQEPVKKSLTADEIRAALDRAYISRK